MNGYEALNAHHRKRIAELEAENAALRKQLAEEEGERWNLARRLEIATLEVERLGVENAALKTERDKHTEASKCFMRLAERRWQKLQSIRQILGTQGDPEVEAAAVMTDLERAKNENAALRERSQENNKAALDLSHQIQIACMDNQELADENAQLRKELERQKQGLQTILELRKIAGTDRYGALTRDEIEEVIMGIDAVLKGGKE